MEEIKEVIDPIKVSELKDHEFEALVLFADYHDKNCKEDEIPEDIYALCYRAMRKCNVTPKHFSEMQLHIIQFKSQIYLIRSLRKFDGSSFGS